MGLWLCDEFGVFLCRFWVDLGGPFAAHDPRLGVFFEIILHLLAITDVIV
jgi:hypothetical protein